MNRRTRPASTVRFEPIPPKTPADYRRRVIAGHEYAPLSLHALNIAIFAAGCPPELTAYPMSTKVLRELRYEFGPQGIPIPTQTELCRAVVELHERNLAAPWWNIRTSQIDRYRPEGS